MFALIMTLAAVIAALVTVTAAPVVTLRASRRRNLYRHNREEGHAMPTTTHRHILAAWRARLASWTRDTHRHDWRYRTRTISGWGIARCQTCGATDLY